MLARRLYILIKVPHFCELRLSRNEREDEEKQEAIEKKLHKESLQWVLQGHSDSSWNKP